MSPLQPGMSAPPIVLPTDGGDVFRLADHAGRHVLVYFYPQADTPACTGENLDFTRLAPEFERLGVTLVGISPDTPERLATFRAKYGLVPILLSDPDKSVISAYGAWGEKKNYGRTYLGLIRTTVLIAPDGTIAQVWPNIRAKGHAERMLKAFTPS